MTESDGRWRRRPFVYPPKRRSLVKIVMLWFCKLNFAKRNAKFGCLEGTMMRFCREITISAKRLVLFREKSLIWLRRNLGPNKFRALHRSPFTCLSDILTRLPNMTNHQIPGVTPLAWLANQRPSEGWAKAQLPVQRTTTCHLINSRERIRNQKRRGKIG